MSEWPVEHDGHEFRPLPASWLDHPAARDSGADGPRCLAVSCEIHGGRILRVRYAHPISGNVVETFGTARNIPNGDGYGPVGLVDGSGWPRSFVPSPGEPVDTIRSCERDHLQELWSERLEALDWDYERDTLDEDPEERLIADGGRSRRGIDRLTVLDLFAGLGGFSSAFEDSGRWRVVQVDIEERFDPDIRADVLELRPDDLPDADLVLASPPCKCFSRAAAWADHFDSDGAPQTDEARDSVALVYHTLGLIEALSPRYWFLENPMGSKIKQYLGEPTGRVTYCQYGTSYQKPTYLWGEHPPMTYRWCSSSDYCHEHGSLEDERDERPLPRDPAKRAKVPRGLSESIRESVEEAIRNPPPEQQTLVAATDGGNDCSLSSAIDHQEGDDAE